MSRLVGDFGHVFEFRASFASRSILCRLSHTAQVAAAAEHQLAFYTCTSDYGGGSRANTQSDCRYQGSRRPTSKKVNKDGGFQLDGRGPGFE